MRDMQSLSATKIHKKMESDASDSIFLCREEAVASGKDGSSLLMAEDWGQMVRHCPPSTPCLPLSPRFIPVAGSAL